MVEQAEFLNRDEVLRMLKRSKTWLYSRVQRREIPHIRVGGKLLFDSEELREWLAAHKVPAKPDL
jgi:excisionase family DNA binding protein